MSTIQCPTVRLDHVLKIGMKQFTFPRALTDSSRFNAPRQLMDFGSMEGVKR